MESEELKKSNKKDRPNYVTRNVNISCYVILFFSMTKQY